jgi:murein DD-endopeptidase MepM/ murein hydrolase activator NlpD
VAANGITNANLIRVGQVLTLPGAAPAAGAPAAAAPAAATAPAGGATNHVVVRGDTISRVASKYGISQAQLVAANGLTGMIYVGQRLSLVATAAAPAPSAGSSSYTVAKGDTVSAIAQRFGTTIKSILAANGISNANLIKVGAALTIPASQGGSAPVRCPVPGARFMNDWGFPRSGGRFHEGNDLFAPRGTPVVAVVGGTVVQTVGKIGGNQVKLAGDDGVSYYYTHLDSFGGAGRVNAGDLVGYVGNSGNAVGGPTHVHFEAHPAGGAAVNPYPRFQPVC